MNNKQEIMTALRQELADWEELLARLSEAQIVARDLPEGLSIKDVIAHLRAWQQRSIARLEAAVRNREPEFPHWPAGLDPNSEGDTDPINAWIFESYRDQSWAQVHQDWREGFLHFVDLGEAVLEQDLLAPGRYPWLGEWSLAFILTASHEHHAEHLESLVDWLARQGTPP